MISIIDQAHLGHDFVFFNLVDAVVGAEITLLLSLTCRPARSYCRVSQQDSTFRSNFTALDSVIGLPENHR